MRKPILLFALILLSWCIDAQDTHFSQYYASPLTLNPALAGKFDGLYRVSGIYRGQWFTPGSLQPYSTASVSLDFSLLKEKMKGNALGIGLVVTNDLQNFTTASSQSKSMINQTRIGINLGYVLALGAKKQYQLSIGFQPQLQLAKFDNNYTFGQGYDPTLNYIAANSGENGFTSAATPKKPTFNISGGLFFSAKVTDWAQVYAGYSMFNIAQPNAVFLNTSQSIGAKYKTPFRHTASVGAEFEVIKKILIIPGAYFQYQAAVYEVTTGITLGYKIINTEEKQATFFLGCWGRAGRDIIPKIGFEYNRFRFSSAFDIRLFQMQQDAHAVAASNQPMAFEISLAYIGLPPVTPKENNYLFSPRF